MQDPGVTLTGDSLRAQHRSFQRPLEIEADVTAKYDGNPVRVNARLRGSFVLCAPSTDIDEETPTDQPSPEPVAETAPAPASTRDYEHPGVDAIDYRGFIRSSSLFSYTLPPSSHSYPSDPSTSSGPTSTSSDNHSAPFAPAPSSVSTARIVRTADLIEQARFRRTSTNISIQTPGDVSSMPPPAILPTQDVLLGEQAKRQGSISTNTEKLLNSHEESVSPSALHISKCEPKLHQHNIHTAEGRRSSSLSTELATLSSSSPEVMSSRQHQQQQLLQLNERIE
jgi:hypothetical protein